jgi:hypothetical protein
MNIRVGDLVQCNLFDPNGSGGVGLVMAEHSLNGYWSVRWCGYEDELTSQIAGAYETHERDLVVISRNRE